MCHAPLPSRVRQRDPADNLRHAAAALARNRVSWRRSEHIHGVPQPRNRYRESSAERSARSTSLNEALSCAARLPGRPWLSRLAVLVLRVTRTQMPITLLNVRSVGRFTSHVA